MAFAIAINLNELNNNILPINRNIEEYIYNIDSYEDLHTVTNEILQGRNLEINEEKFCDMYDELNSDGVITFCAIKIDVLDQVKYLHSLLNLLITLSSGRRYSYAPPRSFGYVYQGMYTEIYTNPLWD